MKASLVATLALTLPLALLAMPRAQAVEGQVTVVTIVDILPDFVIPQNVEAAVEILDKLVADTRQAPGLLSFKVLQDVSRANHFVIAGVWKDRQSFDAYTGLETTVSFREALHPRQGSPLDERIYVDLK